MKKRLICFLCYCFFFGQLCAQNQENDVSRLSDLPLTNSTSEIIFVKDPRSGGFFVHYEGSLTVDNGITFPRKAGGFWVRYFEKSSGVNPCWWGASGDGIHDDLPAINAATKYCQENKLILQFPSGVFRITASWVIGGKTIDESDLFYGTFTKAPSFRMTEHQIARKTTPMIIRGSNSTCIYGDFKSQKLTAVVYYNISGIGPPYRPSSHLYTHEFSDIGFFGQGFFKGGQASPPDSVNKNNKQIGLVMLYCNLAKVNSCTFSGLKYGLIFNECYFSSLTNSNFELCETGLFTHNFNANKIDNIVGFSCSLFADITGSQLIIDNLNGEACATTLKCEGRNIVINGLYAENDDLKKPNNYQLILGSNQSDTGVALNSFSTHIILNAITLTAGGRDLILLKDRMKDVTIRAGNVYGALVSTSIYNTIVLNDLQDVMKLKGPGTIKLE